MNTLPSSIEAYLREAGFSSTELLLLKKLLEDEAMTLRQIASKTGKSTGVLDQAMKKLLRRNIVNKEWINDTWKYRLVSLQAIATWMEEDAKEKQELLRRRHQNFETFLRSLEVDQHRPEMQYYEGDDGFKQAYTRLLDHGKEMLHYFPVICSVEDDPLRDFRVQLFRERRRRGIFARYLIHNTPLGRRFASRDPFEYRKTLLVSEQTYPITFEKVIAGDIVACFNHVEKRVCFLCYPELADMERRLFDRLWKEQENIVGPAPQQQEVKPKEPEVPLSTRVFSGLREFFLSRKSFAILALLAVAAATITYGMWRHTYDVNLQRERERAMSIVAMGATQFDAKDLDQLRTIADIKKPEHAKVVKKLNEIRMQNPGIAYSYIMRPGAKPGYWEFVTDADSVEAPVGVDTNADGVIDNLDQVTYPGQPYNEFDPYSKEEMLGAFSTPDIHSDEYGVYFTTSSPIRDSSGKTVALFMVDILVREVSILTQESFSYFICFIGLFLLFILIRLAAFNRSLLMEIIGLLKIRKVILSIVLCLEIAFFLTLGLYYYTLNIMQEELGNKLMSIAVTAASQFDTNDLNQLHWARDMKTDAYQRVFTKLNQIRDTNDRVKYAFILRPSANENMWEFVADADTNYNLPYYVDLNHDGIAQPEEYLYTPPGVQYDVTNYPHERDRTSLLGPINEGTDTDQWGTGLSANAPIRDANNRGVAILSIDMDITDLYHATNEKFTTWLWFIGICASVLLIQVFFFPLWKSQQARSTARV